MNVSEYLQYKAQAYQKWRKYWMNSPAEIAKNYISTGESKCKNAVSKMIVLAIFAGMFIAIAGVGATTDHHIRAAKKGNGRSDAEKLAFRVHRKLYRLLDYRSACRIWRRIQNVR